MLVFFSKISGITLFSAARTAQACFQPSGDYEQQLISCVMAKQVINLLEFIQIQKKNGERPALACSRLDTCF